MDQPAHGLWSCGSSPVGPELGVTCHPSAGADLCLVASCQTDWDTWDRRGRLGWTRLRLLVCSPGQCRST